MATLTLAITGASGVIYGVRLLEYLLQEGHRLYVCITREGGLVLEQEMGLSWSGSPAQVRERILRHCGGGGSLEVFSEEDLTAPIASGSVPVEAMVIAPCSMRTCAGIATGYAQTLVERAADVTLKEARPLILVPRETPLHAIHLENLLRLARMGVRIIPAMPGFYHRPKRVEDLVDFVVGRILDHLGIPHRLHPRWRESG